MADFCFKNNSFNLSCKLCNIRYYSSGEDQYDIPKIKIENSTLTIVFGEKVIAKEFSSYFGSLQEIINNNKVNNIIIDISNTTYMNQFCISKLLLTLCQIDDKKIRMILPITSNKNKMLRFFYNLGILDMIFNYPKFMVYVNNSQITNYKEIYDFNDCYDKAIFPFAIFQTTKTSNDYISQVEKYIDDVLQSTSMYFSISNKSDVFVKIKDRLYLYLYEIIDNIFEHAYDKNIIFSISITNNYLPPYMRDRKNNIKFLKRIDRLQKEVPQSIYGDIQDRFFGSINLFVDDIGKSIANTYKGSYQQMYKQIFIEGVSKRKKGKTPVNGLKLIGDEIANNNDTLWVHDNKYWINCAFWENSNISSIDESVREVEGNSYNHRPIDGMTYDIMINLAKNSSAKRRTYKGYGCKLDISIEQIHDIYNNKLEESSENELLVIDLLNIKNKTKSFKSVLSQNFKYLLFRPRAVRKNKQKNEIINRIFNYLPDNSSFDELIIYDLNQTTLFQMRAVIETDEVSAKLMKHKVNKVILVSEECWFFVCEIINKKYQLFKTASINYVRNNKDKLLLFLKNIVSNDRKLLNNYLRTNNKDIIIYGNIQWENLNIKHYLDIEKMLEKRHFFDVIYKGLLRVSGMLNESQKIVFLEYFMENLFGNYVNEYKENAIQKIYFGSVLLTKKTEKNFTQKDDQRFYLFKHGDSDVSDEKYFFVFDYPEVNSKKNMSTYRRVTNSNRIEKYLAESEEFKFYFSDDYKKIIENLEIKIGYLSCGIIDIIRNKILYESFLKFVIEILKIERKKQGLIYVKISEKLNEQYNSININLEKDIKTAFHPRDIGKKIFINEEYDIQAYNILITDEITMMDFLKIKKDNPVNMYITMFNSIKFDDRFDKIIDLGYVPFIPLFIGEKTLLIDSNNIENFISFSNSLNSTYRRAVNQYIEGDALRFNNNLYKQLLGSLDQLKDVTYNTIENNILIDTIMSCIGIKDSPFITTNNLYEGIYSSLILLIKTQHSLTILTRLDNSRVIKSVLKNYLNLKDKISDSIVIFFEIVIIYFMDINSNEIMSLFKESYVFSNFLSQNSYLIKIILAKLYDGSNRMEFQRELNEIFVNSDIAFYYNMLYQNLFNNHGSIHDSVLNKFSKSIVESNGNIGHAKEEEVKAVIAECFSLLRLTKPYDETDEKLVELENELQESLQDFCGFSLQINNVLESVTEIAKSRFVILNKDDYSKDCRNFLKQIVEKRNKKNNVNGHFQFKKDYLIVLNDLDYDQRETWKNIILYNDTYMIEELAYLLDNSIKNSNDILFSLENNEDRQNNIWITCTINKDRIVIKFFNGLKDQFETVINRIHSKKRIGKTHLEKFNIHVSYSENPPYVKSNGCNVIETKIEIPYFH